MSLSDTDPLKMYRPRHVNVCRQRARKLSIAYKGIGNDELEKRDHFNSPPLSKGFRVRTPFDIPELSVRSDWGSWRVERWTFNTVGGCHFPEECRITAPVICNDHLVASSVLVVHPRRHGEVDCPDVHCWYFGGSTPVEIQCCGARHRLVWCAGSVQAANQQNRRVDTHGRAQRGEETRKRAQWSNWAFINTLENIGGVWRDAASRSNTREQTPNPRYIPHLTCWSTWPTLPKRQEIDFRLFSEPSEMTFFCTAVSKIFSCYTE